MAKAAESAGSDKAELKKWLNRADAGPINMAFAFAKDGTAMLKLDGMKQGRALEKTLKDGAPDSKNHRFGTVQIDPDNPDVVRFFVNKAAGGAARKLSVALKGTGFKKVELVMDDGSVEAGGDDDDESENEAVDGVSAGAASGDTDSQDSLAAGDRPDPPDLSGAEPSAPSLDGTGGDTADGTFSDPQYEDPAASATPDAATLTKQLTGLVKQMMGAIKKDPTQKTVLAELATDAQASLKRGDLETAAAGLEILRQAVADALGQDPSADGASGGAPASADPAATAATDPTADGGGTDTAAGDTGGTDWTDPAATADLDSGGQQAAPPPPPSVDAGALTSKLKKSKIVWTATRAKVDADLQKLSQAISAASEGEDMDDDVEGQFMSAVEPVLAELDDTLNDELDQAANASDDATRQKLLAKARQTVARYSAYVQSNPIIDNIDSNPFLPLQIGKTLTATLTTLTTIMR